MITCAVCVKDLATGLFSQPTFIPHIGLAKREFAELVNNPEHVYGKHPHDYEIYVVAGFDDTLGRFIFDDSYGVGVMYPVLLDRGRDLVINR